MDYGKTRKNIRNGLLGGLAILALSGCESVKDLDVGNYLSTHASTAYNCNKLPEDLVRKPSYCLDDDEEKVDYDDVEVDDASGNGATGGGSHSGGDGVGSR